MQNLLTKKVLILIVFISGCAVMKPDKEYFSGSWEESSYKKGVYINAGKRLEFRFINDSLFYFHAEKLRGNLKETDSCSFYLNNRFAAGKYKVTGSELCLSGEWTDELFRQHTYEPCVTPGRFNWIFEIRAANEQTVELNIKNPPADDYGWVISETIILTKY